MAYRFLFIVPNPNHRRYIHDALNHDKYDEQSQKKKNIGKQNTFNNTLSTRINDNIQKYRLFYMPKM